MAFAWVDRRSSALGLVLRAWSAHAHAFCEEEYDRSCAVSAVLSYDKLLMTGGWFGNKR